ncbi:MAG: HAMP domain-containing methyl-accepting chemotaxis protein, partial [Bacillota bacterium]
SRNFRTQFAPEIAMSLVENYRHVQDAMKPLAEKNARQAHDVSQGALRTAAEANTLMLATAAAGLVLAVAFNLWVGGRLQRPIRAIAAGLQRRAEGDLAFELGDFGRDELGAAARAFNESGRSLSRLVRQVLNAAQQFSAESQRLAASATEVGESAQQVAAVVDQMAKGADEQARVATETGKGAAAMQQVVDRVVQAVKRLREQASDVEAKSRSGGQSMERVAAQMSRITAAVQSSSDSIQELGQHSRRINEILGVITGIADQTNLLALNAAIEAARAGQQGRGFAVVAEEVRKLADQSRVAADQIAELLGRIQAGTGRAIKDMEQAGNEAKAGVSVVEESGTAFWAMLTTAQQAIAEIGNVAEAASQLAEASGTVVRAVESMAAATEETASGTEEISSSTQQQSGAVSQIAEAARELAGQARALEQAFSVFRLAE